MATKVYPELPPPDVEVYVEQVKASVTTQLPTLPPVVVGPCFQIMEVMEKGEPNSNAILALPAVIASDTDSDSSGQYTVSSGTYFKLKINNGAEITINLPSGAQAVSALASAINSTLASNEADGLAIAEVIPGVISGRVRLQLRTKGTGAYKTLEITDSANLHTSIGFPDKWRAVGSDQYTQGRIKASPYLFPSTRQNLDELVFDPDKVTVAFDEGGSALRILSKDSAVERAGSFDSTTNVNKVIDDGDGDGYSPWIQFTANNTKDEFGVSGSIGKLAVAANKASMTGDNAIGTPSDLNGKTLIISVSGSPYQTITFANISTLQDIVDQINAYFKGLASLSSNKLVLSTENVEQGLAQKGREAYIHIHKNSTAVRPTNYLNGGGSYNPSQGINCNIKCGTWFPVAVGDEFYLDGKLQGKVTRILSGGGSADSTCIFEIDKKLPEQDLANKQFYFVSKNLSGSITPGSKPTPEVYVTSDGSVHIKQCLIRDVNGVPLWRYLDLSQNWDPVYYGQAVIYLGYKALRLDVSPSAKEPGLLNFSTTSEIEEEIGPVSADNPLALAAYLCKQACPSKNIYAIGVDEISSDAPEGTQGAYTRAADFLANHEVYTIVPLTQDLSVLQMFATHVNTYSSVDNKLERCLFGTVSIPTRGPNKSCASGTDGTNISETQFNTNIPGLTTILQDQGINLSNLSQEELYLDLESNDRRYLISQISGSIVTINTTPSDPFYYTGNLGPAGTFIGEAFSVMQRGKLLVDSAGNPDKDKVAQALADIASGFSSKRVIIGAPGEVEVIISGLQMTVPSYYAAAVEAGKRAQLDPHIGFTNTQTPGIYGVRKSNDYFSKTQMNIAAGGGIWWWFKQTPNSPVTVRHQLTTDVSSIESREWSLISALDFLAKVVRLQIRPLLGRYVINDELLRMVDGVLTGISNELVHERKIFAELAFGTVEVVKDKPDTLEVYVDAVRFYPFNKMKVRIRV